MSLKEVGLVWKQGGGAISKSEASGPIFPEHCRRQQQLVEKGTVKKEHADSTNENIRE